MTPAAFVQLWRHVAELAEQARTSSPITVVLAGDVLEILRSEQWFQHGTRPYNFDGEELPAAALHTANSIGQAILDENTAGLAALAGGGTASSPGGNVRFVFLYGNHDRLLRASALSPVRAESKRNPAVHDRRGFCERRRRLPVESRRGNG